MGGGGTTPWETGGMAGRLRDCLGSEREEATTSVLSPSVISREWASCMTNTAGWRVREGTPPRARRSRSREILSIRVVRQGVSETAVGVSSTREVEPRTRYHLV